MRPYLAAFRARARTVFRYRAAAAAGMFAQVAFGFILVMILESWYGSAGGAPAPMTMSQTAAYVWLGQAFFAMLPWNPDPELRDLIRSGEVARDLLRPLDLYWLWFTRTLAWRLVSSGLRCAAILAFAGFALPRLGMVDLALPAPAGASALACFAVLMAMAALMSASMTVALSCFQFRQVSAAGITAIFAAIVSFFSGLTVPLPLLDGPIAAVAGLLPFRALADLPFRFWSGAIPVNDAPAAFLFQLAWLAAITAGGRVFLNMQLRDLAVAGS